MNAIRLLESTQLLAYLAGACEGRLPAASAVDNVKSDVDLEQDKSLRSRALPKTAEEDSDDAPCRRGRNGSLCGACGAESGKTRM